MENISIETRTYTNPVAMLIDDSEIDNFVNGKQIEHYKFAQKTIVYNSSVQAIRFLRTADMNKKCTSELPSYIFLDLNMPVMNGYQFLEEYNKLSGHIKNNCKVVVLTSSMNPADLLRTGSNHNVHTCLSKPLIKSNLDQLENAGMKAYRTAS